MKRAFLLSGLVFTIIFSSCIPHKDVVYLQNKESSMDSTQILIEKQSPYRIQVNDILNIRVKALDQENVQILNPIGDDNLNASGEERAFFDGFTVDIHGEIRIPTLGKMNVLGYTTEEIEKTIQKKLLAEQFNETANIFVTVKLTGLRYTTNGEVNQPGTQVLYQERVNIFQALANAGDITNFGNRKDVILIRQYPQGQKIHHLDLTDINVMNSPFYYIQPNDMIYVKPLKIKALGLGGTVRDNLTLIVTLVSLVSTIVIISTR